MAVDAQHPDYADRKAEWQMMRDCARGAKDVAARGEHYLPMPSGFRVQEDGGRAMYTAYSTRAQFPDLLAPTIGGMVGVIHRTEAQITMPKAMEGLWERATKDGLTLEALHRRVTAELLLIGRYCLMADASATGSDLPWLAGYSAEALINWDANRDFFVLDESGPIRDGFNWKEERKFRVLSLTEGGQYQAQVYEGTVEAGDALIPTARGGLPLDVIPLTVIGARDLSLTPDEPPLIGVARSSLALYRLDADYRHQLYMTGQETLVIINGDAPSAVGAGVVLTLRGDEGNRPDAKYVGPAGTGIAAHRIAIQDEREAAVAAGARIFDSVQKSAESGEALRLRYAAQTATLTTIAQASAAGLEKALRYVALMIGANPQEVIVKPNLKFVEATMTPQEAAELVKVWQAGVISKLTLYENLQRGEIASAERSFDEEEDLIETETPAGLVDRSDNDEDGA